MDKARKLPADERTIFVDEVLVPRWVALREECQDWINETGALIESLYGINARVLYENDQEIPPLDAPDFASDVEAASYREVQNRLYRLHQVIERHQDDDLTKVPPRPLTLSERKEYRDVLLRSIRGATRKRSE